MVRMMHHKPIPRKNVLATLCTAYLTQSDFIATVSKQQNTCIDTLEKVQASLLSERPASIEDCAAWARRRFHDLYYSQICQLLHNFPLDQRMATGEPFWSGTKRPPTPARFDPENVLHAQFVYAATCLRAHLYGLRLQPSHTIKAIAALAAAAPTPEFAPRVGLKIAANDKELEEQQKAEKDATTAGGGDGGWDLEEKIASLAATLPSPRALAGFQVRCMRVF